MAESANASRCRRRPSLADRLLALLIVSGFFTVQYCWWREGVRYRLWWEPTPVLGPLFFLANQSVEDDWLGVLLLVVLVPCILAFLIWPTRLTAWLGCLAILAWMGPGIFLILRAAP
jgi:hypothetical protein